ncbi:MAG: aminotransferase class I/II-fold pyridoxal phosphate-dependent enzyme [Acidobacteriota bacterium]
MRIEPFRMERMQSTYENYVDFNLSESGVHPMTPLELLQDVEEPERLLSRELGYCQSNGSETLRDRIALFYPGAARENVLVSNGGSEANYATLWSLLEKGDRVAYMLPNYLQTWGLSRAYAGMVDPFRLVRRRDADRTRWALDVEGLHRAVTKRTRLILVTNPNNPTGAVLTADEMDEVVRAARRFGAWIVADEIYRGAELSGRTIPSFWGRYERVLVTAGLSKAFGLPGLRIGWIVGPARAVQRAWSYRDYTTIAPGLLSDHLAGIAMEPSRREAILARTRSIIRANLPVLEDWVRAHGEILEYTAPEAGAIAFMRYRLSIGSIPLVDRLRLERSVLIIPGDHFGSARHIRIGYGSERVYLVKGLERIGEMFRALRAAARWPAARGGTRRGRRPGAARRRAAAPRRGRAAGATA